MGLANKGSAKDLDQLAIDTIRTLAMDAVEQANSGPSGHAHGARAGGLHPVAGVPALRPGRPGLAQPRPLRALCGPRLDAALRDAPPDRRQGHGAGQRRPRGEPAVSLDDLKSFRQLHSRCPGHPEYGGPRGVETTTGPLGQGVANSVGMAIAARWLAAHYNRPGFELFDFNVYALAGDGDLMEGVAARPPRWPATSSCPTCAGSTTTTASPSKATPTGLQRGRGHALRGLRLERAAGRRRQRPGRDLAALAALRATADRPTLIIVRSHIAYGAPNKQDTAAAHGGPLGDEEIRLTKQPTAGPRTPSSSCPTEVRDALRRRHRRPRRGGPRARGWTPAGRATGRRIPELAAELDTIRQRRRARGLGRGPAGLSRRRQGHGHAGGLRQGAQRPGAEPALAAGRFGRPGAVEQDDADLRRRGRSSRPADSGGRNFHFGIREHAMAAIANGMALCGLRPYGATFFVFTDYCGRPCGWRP